MVSSKVILLDSRLYTILNSKSANICRVCNQTLLIESDICAHKGKKGKRHYYCIKCATQKKLI